jgi:exosortase D (VPLPA-CTERM-specific)
MNERAPNSDKAIQINYMWLAYAAIVVATLIFLFRDGLSVMVNFWEQKEEYNHGYLIPVVALYLALVRAEDLRKVKVASSFAGLPLVLFGLALLFVGELSAVYIITQYAFLIALVGLVVTAYGWAGARTLWVPLAYLFFMIPLPSFLYNNLSSELQLLSSQFGVAFLRLVGISVYLEGNVIDLGEFQLQVAEACSGLRYLFPLMSFGFLCAFLFNGRIWQKVFIFLSSIPITLFMNSFRIGVIGVLVEYYGISMARGFLHDFEGWFIFMACVGVLFFEMWVFAMLSGKQLVDVFDVKVPPLGDFAAFVPQARPSQLTWGLIAIFLVMNFTISDLDQREEIVPQRQALSTFPLRISEWRGTEMGLERMVLDELKLDDYVLASFSSPSSQLPIELYVAYYGSQRKGASVHSPRACLPGGGWRIDEFDQYRVEGVGPFGEGINVNRSVIIMGDSRQLVYYWFQQRGRNITNEYLVKWYIFWDAITMNRTDGALVRLVTAVPEGADIAEYDNKLKEFLRTVDPQLSYYLPGKLAEPQEAQVSYAR